jgi:hypothetical protein
MIKQFPMLYLAHIAPDRLGPTAGTCGALAGSPTIGDGVRQPTAGQH